MRSIYFFLAFLSLTPSLQANSSIVSDLEVHEWGVIAQSDDGKYIATNRPYGRVKVPFAIALEPILYFHSKDQNPFSLTVTFPVGKITSCFPNPSTNSGTSISWKNVEFTYNTIKEPLDLSTDNSISPLDNWAIFEQIANTLNSVDADEIKVSGKKSRFLFYEGPVGFKNIIKVDYDSNNTIVIIQNNGKLPIYDLLITSGKPYNQKKGVSFGWLDQLSPGDKVRIQLEHGFSKKSPFPDLRKMGFSDSEATAFEATWKYSIINQTLVNDSSVFYRLSPEECDKTIQLQFDPQPQKIIRALFVYINKN